MSVNPVESSPMKIAHLSDLHYGFSTERDAWVEHRLIQVQRAHPDHLILSGDLSQSGRADEFRALAAWLCRCGFSTSDRLTVLPGNHDLYNFFFKDFHAGGDFYRKWRRIPRTAMKIHAYDQPHYEKDLSFFVHNFRNAFHSILTLNDRETDPYPFIKLLDERVALIVLDSNRCLPRISRNVFCSNGYVDPGSVERILAQKELAGRFKIVALHHHLLPASVVSRREGRLFGAATRLINRRELVALLDRIRPDLVLHGHYHRQEIYQIGRAIPVMNNGDYRKWGLIEITDHVTITTSD